MCCFCRGSGESLPSGRKEPLTVLGFVVRIIEEVEAPTLGVAFRLVQPSMDVLGNPQLAAGTTA